MLIWEPSLRLQQGDFWQRGDQFVWLAGLKSKAASKQSLQADGPSPETCAASWSAAFESEGITVDALKRLLAHMQLALKAINNVLIPMLHCGEVPGRSVSGKHGAKRRGIQHAVCPVLKLLADALARFIRQRAKTLGEQACCSSITASTASWLSPVYPYDSVNKKLVRSKATEAATISSENFRQMNTWFTTLMDDSFT